MNGLENYSHRLRAPYRFACRFPSSRNRSGVSKNSISFSTSPDDAPEASGFELLLLR